MKINDKQLIEQLEDDLMIAHDRWVIYSQLFAKGVNRLLLNRYTGNFAAILQQLLEDDIILRISKLTDPAFTKKRKQQLYNCTLDLAISQLDLQADPTTSALRSKIERRCRTIKVRRDKKIAHADLVAKVTPLLVSKATVRGIFRDTELLIHELNDRAGMPKFFLSSRVFNGDGNDLIFHLKRIRSLHRAATKCSIARRLFLEP